MVILSISSQIDDPRFPDSASIIGSDDSNNKFFLLYTDVRGVSRKYSVSFEANVWKWWRNAPGFSQRFTGIYKDEDQTIIGKWELSRDDKTWEDDLEVTYTRLP